MPDARTTYLLFLLVSVTGPAAGAFFSDRCLVPAIPAPATGGWAPHGNDTAETKPPRVTREALPLEHPLPSPIARGAGLINVKNSQEVVG